MNLQVLVAAMYQKDHSLLKKMNIKSDVIVGNQCDSNSIEPFEYNGNKALYLNFAERGVGLNRNNALMRATGDVCLFADDDMVYADDYVAKVMKAFEEHSDADVIVFNLEEKKTTRFVIKKSAKVNRFNYLKYGAVRTAVKLASVRKNAIYFNQCFGGGTEHNHGEDTLFLTSCLNNGLKIYAEPVCIAKLTEERESTWNKGFDEKYFHDQGCLYKTISRKWWRFLCLQDSLRHCKKYGVSFVEAYRKMSNS